MNWCCSIFEALVGNRGLRGLSVVVCTIVHDRFVLQARGVDDGAQLPADLQVAVTVAEQQVIFFCPGCGVELESHYRGRTEELRDEPLCA